MLVEKKLIDALYDHKKGKKVIVLHEFEDGSLHSCPLEDFFDDRTHYLVDVPAYENPEWNKAVIDMIQSGGVAPEQPEEEETPNFSGGTKTSAPEEVKENKFKVVEELTKQGKTVKEIVQITGYDKNLIYQYRCKIKREQKKETPIEFFPGYNADRHLCKTCMWRGNDKYKNSSAIGCEYSVKNGHSRGCKVEDCNVYEKGDPQKNITPIVLV